MTPEQRAALRNILATQEARKTDPSIYHVQEVDPDLHRYPTPEELKALHAALEEWHKDIQKVLAERNKNDSD